MLVSTIYYGYLVPKNSGVACPRSFVIWENMTRIEYLGMGLLINRGLKGVSVTAKNQHMV